MPKTVHQAVGVRRSRRPASISRSGRIRDRMVAVTLLRQCRKMGSHKLRVRQYTQPSSRPMRKAGMDCQGLRCITANRNADQKMAFQGFLPLASIPRSIIPRQRNSSSSGARMQAERIISHRAELTNASSKAALMRSGIGRNEVAGSATTERDSIAMAASANTAQPGKWPKCGASSVTGLSP